MDIEKYAEHLRSVADQQEKIVLEVIQRNEPTLVDLNTAQLMEGKDADGNSLGEYRNEDYARFKRTLNPRGVVDLKLEGDFHDSIYIEAQRFPIFADARDPKTGKLIDTYGKILGFTKESKEAAADQIGPEAIEEIQARIFLIR
jgi:hypothetical protein